MAKLTQKEIDKKLLDYDTLRSRGLNQKEACARIGHRAHVVWRWQKSREATRQTFGLPTGQANGDL